MKNDAIERLDCLEYEDAAYLPLEISMFIHVFDIAIAAGEITEVMVRDASNENTYVIAYMMGGKVYQSNKAEYQIARIKKPSEL